jgi:hypothetical protein
MHNFKSQVELVSFAYTQANGMADEMITIVAKLLMENPNIMKSHKYEELTAKGEKGFVGYAKVKVREHFTRTLVRKSNVISFSQAS